MSPHKSAFIRAFVRREKRARFSLLLGNPARRQGILDGLNHGKDMDRSCAALLLPTQRSAKVHSSEY